MVKYCMLALDVESMTEKILGIQLRGGPPWGFRLKGGKGADAPLFISTVNAKGRQQGLKEGDLVLSVNGQSTENMTHAEAQRAVKESLGKLELHIQRRIPADMNGESRMENSSSLDEDVHPNHSSWSTDSTSTGSTIIHISPQSSEEPSSGTERVWSPSTRKKINLKVDCDLPPQSEEKLQGEEDTSPVWQPFGAPYDGPQFRPVKLEVAASTVVPQSQLYNKKDEKETTEDQREEPAPSGKTTPEAPLSSVSTTFVKSGWSSHLPPSQSPTITLLQKAREGQIPKGAIYLDDKPDPEPLPKNAVLIDQKVTVEGDKVHTDSYYAVPSLSTETSTYNIKAPSKYDGIGPTEYGIPVGLRTGVKEEYASDWYKTMYKSLHRGRYPNEPSHAVHYGGYMSEPEFDRKDVYRPKYATLDHRRKPDTAEQSTDKTKKFGSDSSVVRHEQRKYQVEPRSIAEYEPGRSSLAEKEFQKFWSDFWDSMDDLHEHLGDISPRPHHQGLSRRWPNVLLSDGYDSDSTLIRKTGRVPYVDPEQQKAWYKEIQKGGEIPLIGLRKSAPEKPAEVRSNKPQPATRVYGVEPPCFNHKHIPDSSCKLTPAPIFRAAFLKSMAAPAPPKRVSSKRTPVLQSLSATRNNGLNRFHSCEDLYGLGRTAWSEKYRCSSSLLNGSLDKKQDSYKISHATPNYLKNACHQSRNFWGPCPRAEGPVAYSDDCISSCNHRPYQNWLPQVESSAQSFNWIADHKCASHLKTGFDLIKSPTTSSKHDTNSSVASNGTNEVGSKTNEDKVTHFNLSDSDCLPSRPSNWIADMKCVSDSSDSYLKPGSDWIKSSSKNQRYRADSSVASNGTEININGDGSEVALFCLSDNDSSSIYNETSSEPFFYSNASVCSYFSLRHSLHLPKSVDWPKQDTFRNSAVIEANVVENNLSHPNENRKNKCSNNTISNIQNTSRMKSYRRTAAVTKDNVKAICSKERIDAKNFTNLETSKYFPEKHLPRMITVLPSMAHISKVPVVSLEPKVVRSVPQIGEKQFCKIVLNPLRMYLKQFGGGILQDFEDCTLKQGSCVNGSHKLNILSNNADVYINGIILGKHNCVCKELRNASPYKDNSNLLNSTYRFKNSVLPISNSSPSTQNGTYKPSNMSTKNGKNIVKNNAIIYHQYISTMVRSVAKSRKFLYLINFYSNLENNSFKVRNDSKFQVIKIREFDASWSKTARYRKWEQEQDKSLRVKRSSVEDLRHLFQSRAKEGRNAHKVSFRYTKLWYNVSVSNLVEKYNNIHTSEENLDGRLKSEMCRLKNKPIFKGASEYSCSDPFAQKHVNFSDCTAAVAPSFPASVRSSSSDLRTDVRTKVQYFEDVYQTKRLKKCSSLYQYTSESVKVNKLGRSRNLSWSDLREIEPSAGRKSVFSPRYLPEKAMSCLDLTFVSECSQSSLSNSERGWTSSTASCISQEECTDTHIRTIKTGTVSRIRNQLEKFVMSRSQSVPQNIADTEDEKRSFRFPSLASSESVQNLKKLFELDRWKQKESPRLCANEMEASEAAKDRGYLNMRNRIQSLISKFEQSHLLDTARNIALCQLNVSEFSASRNVTKYSFNSVASYTIAGGWLGNISKLEKNGRWMKLFMPRVTNSFPKPYVKTCQPASPHQYQETEVNIHYRSPIRHLEKEYIEEEELRKRQEDAMRKFYEEERRKKHQQELAEIEMRRHSDFFTPSQKSPIPLNRYDNPFEMSYGQRLAPPGGSRGPPPKTIARAIYPFTAQTTRELSLNKGDILYITKQIDKNWYEGEHHGLIGIFPVTYAEIIPNEKANLQPRKAMEGEAIVKYNFRAVTPIELSLFKGEKVILTKRMDRNWYEGRLGTKKGIFPVSYVNVLKEPGETTFGSRAISPKPPASPVYSPIVNGSPPKVEGPTFNTGLRPLQDKPPLNVDTKSPLTQSLHIDTYNEPIPYRSLYSYKPQNDDELELKEGDTVYVMEKCDDGWYVGTSLRTGLFGTFPGNYVERI